MSESTGTGKLAGLKYLDREAALEAGLRDARVWVQWHSFSDQSGMVLASNAVTADMLVEALAHSPKVRYLAAYSYNADSANGFGLGCRQLASLGYYQLQKLRRGEERDVGSTPEAGERSERGSGRGSGNPCGYCTHDRGLHYGLGGWGDGVSSHCVVEGCACGRFDERNRTDGRSRTDG